VRRHIPEPFESAPNAPAHRHVFDAPSERSYPTTTSRPTRRKLRESLAAQRRKEIGMTTTDIDAAVATEQFEIEAATFVESIERRHG
jgi:hypothetical protein